MLNSTLQMQRQDHWNILSAAGLVDGDLPADLDQGMQQAWYIRVMLGFSGWLGALFLLGFVGIGFEFVFKHAYMAISLGVAVCAVAYVLLSLPNRNDFVQQFGLAVSMAGQGCIFIGVFTGLEPHTTLIALVVLVVQIALVFVMPNLIHRFLSGLGIAWAISYLLESQGVAPLSRGVIAVLMCVTWWSPLHYSYQKIVRPLAFALSFSLLLFEVFSVMHPLSFVVASRSGTMLPNLSWIGTTLLNVALLGSTVLLLQREAITLSSKLAAFSLCATLLVATSAYFMPGFATALLLLMIAFAHRNRIMIGMSVAAMLGFLAHFYYQLQLNLLEKSMALAISAVCLFALRALMLKLFPATKGEMQNAESN